MLPIAGAAALMASPAAAATFVYSGTPDRQILTITGLLGDAEVSDADGFHFELTNELPFGGPGYWLRFYTPEPVLGATMKFSSSPHVYTLGVDPGFNVSKNGFQFLFGIQPTQLPTFDVTFAPGFETQPFQATFAAIPEPATWAMMIMGFGLAGTALRRRRMVLA